MNTIQKAATAFVALIITVVGATLVTAPLALADVHRISLHQAMSAPYAVLNGSSTGTLSSRQG